MMNKDKKTGAFYASLRRELNRMVSRRLYFGVCMGLPLFCIFFMSTIFGTGAMENIPIGIVDMDQTATSRKVVRTLGTVSTAKVAAYYPDALAARKAVVSKDIYAYVVLPKNFESDLVAGRNATIPYFIHYALLSVGVELGAALEETFGEVAVAPTLVAGMSMGASEEQVESTLIPVYFEAHPLYNPSLDYSVYLSNPFFFVLFQILILLTTMYVIGSEIKFKTSDDWLATAQMNIYAAVFAKLLPYTLIFMSMGILSNVVMFNIMHIPFTASFWPINLYTMLFVVSTQALAVFIFSLFPALSIIISIGSMLGSLGATLCGVTFPMFAMHPIIHQLSYLFPVRHFVEILQNILYGNYGFKYSWQSVSALFIYLLIALLLLPHLKKATLSHAYEDIE